MLHCPICKSTSTAEIIYGLVRATNQEVMAGVESGRYVLGGCIAYGNDPNRKCHSCGHAWVHQTPQAVDE